MRTHLAVLFVLAGCPDRSVSKLPPEQQGEVTKKISTSVDLDILFVIDNSSSTSDKQTVFAKNLAGFADALARFPSAPSFHIGVVSTTISEHVDIVIDGRPATNCPRVAPNDDGLLHNSPVTTGCSTPSDRYISDGAGRKNYPGTLADTLSCIGHLGDLGCGFEAPLEAMKRALDGTHPENAGFLRPDAYLAVIILTDEDDCSVRDPALFALPSAGPGDFRGQPLFAYACDQPISATTPGMYTNCRARTDSYLEDPASYIGFLSSIKDPSQLVVALIAGDPATTITTGPLTIGTSSQSLALQPSCSATINGNAAIGRPAIRLADFVGRLGDRGLVRTVCQPDYSSALADISKLLSDAVSPCLEGQLDLSSGGPQCTVAEDNVPIAPCSSGAQPCWSTTVDPAACTQTPTHLELHVAPAPTAGTVIDVSCAVAPAP